MARVKELLPIGSVVVLKGGKKPLMIYGIRQTNQETGVEYDYIGVLYPEGNVGNKTQFLFNDDNIEKIVFRGFEDECRARFLDKLEEFYRTRESSSVQK